MCGCCSIVRSKPNDWALTLESGTTGTCVNVDSKGTNTGAQLAPQTHVEYVCQSRCRRGSAQFPTGCNKIIVICRHRWNSSGHRYNSLWSGAGIRPNSFNQLLSFPTTSNRETRVDWKNSPIVQLDEILGHLCSNQISSTDVTIQAIWLIQIQATENMLHFIATVL